MAENIPPEDGNRTNALENERWQRLSRECNHGEHNCAVPHILYRRMGVALHVQCKLRVRHSMQPCGWGGLEDNIYYSILLYS